MMLLWLSLLAFAILPVCAVLGGGVTWWLTRNEEPEDGTLVKHFVFATMMFLLASLAVARSDRFLDRYDPVRRAEAALAKLPAQVALKQAKAWEYERMAPRLAAAARGGVPIAEILSAARVAHLQLARHYLPWAPGRSTLRYAEAVLGGLQELRVSDPATCVRLAWPMAGEPFDVDQHVSPAIAHDLQEAMAEVLVRSDLQPGAAQRNRGDDPANQPYDLSQLQLAYASLRAELQQRHGDIVGKLHTAEIRTLPADRACAATIDLFRGALQQQPAIARGLLGNMLRT